MNSFRNLCRIGLLMFLVGCCSGIAGTDLASVPPAPRAEVVQHVDASKLKDATVAIVKEVSGVVLATCAGVWVDKNLILTASHCIDDESLMFKYSTENDYDIDKARNAILISTDKNSDLALLLADPKNVPEHAIATISNDEIVVGEEVHIVGHTSGYTWTYTRGYSSSIRNAMKSPAGIYIKKVLQISAPTWMGNSGGGVFNKKGELIGISSWISGNGPNLSFFIHKDMIHKFVNKI